MWPICLLRGGKKAFNLKSSWMPVAFESVTKTLIEIKKFQLQLKQIWMKFCTSTETMMGVLCITMHIAITSSSRTILFHTFCQVNIYTNDSRNTIHKEIAPRKSWTESTTKYLKIKLLSWWKKEKKRPKKRVFDRKKSYKVAIFDDYNIRANHFHAVHQGTQSWRESSI